MRFTKIKPIYILIIIFIIIISVIYALLNSFDNDDKNDLLTPYIENATYTFSGDSEHFKFDTGKVYFSNDYSQILITDFSQTKEIKKLKNEKVTILFDGKEWSSLDNSYNLNKLKEYITEFQFYEGGKLCGSDSNFDCEKTAFDIANKENFKDILKVIIEYCTNDNVCLKEQFKINFDNNKKQ